MLLRQWETAEKESLVDIAVAGQRLLTKAGHVDWRLIQDMFKQGRARFGQKSRVMEGRRLYSMLSLMFFGADEALQRGKREIEAMEQDMNEDTHSLLQLARKQRNRLNRVLMLTLKVPSDCKHPRTGVNLLHVHVHPLGHAHSRHPG